MVGKIGPCGGGVGHGGHAVVSIMAKDTIKQSTIMIYSLKSQEGTK